MEGRATNTWEQAIDALVVHRRHALTGYAYLVCGSLGEAEDLVQDALVAALVRNPAGVAPIAAESYVRRTIVRTHVDGFRRRKRWAAIRHLHVVRDDDPDTNEGSPDQVAVRVDLQRALAELSPRERTCTVLRFYDDLTVPQIADALSLSTGSVKRYLSDAVRRLGPLLEPPAVDTVANSLPTGGTR